jgi:hypothetical protein
MFLANAVDLFTELPRRLILGNRASETGDSRKVGRWEDAPDSLLVHTQDRAEKNSVVRRTP